MRNFILLTLFLFMVRVPLAFSAASQSFDGGSSDAEVDCGTDSAFSITTTITMAAWVKWDTSGGGFDVIMRHSGNANQYGMWHNGTGDTMHCLIRNKTYDTTSALDDDLWHHVACTYDGSKIRLYFDGVKEIDDDDATAPTAIDDELWIGNKGGTTEAWIGNIAYTHLYNRVLTDGEIVELSLNPSISPTSLAGYWKMLDPSTTILDSSGNGRNCTANSGGTTPSADGPPVFLAMGLPL